MSSKPKKTPEPGWYPLAEVCKVFDWSPSHFHANVKPHLPADDILAVGRNRFYRARGVVDLLLDRQTTRVPMTEQLLDIEARTALAKLERAETAGRLALLEEERKILERDVRVGELVPIGELQESFGIVADRLRKLGDRMQKVKSVKGQVVHDALNDTLDQIDQAVQSLVLQSLTAQEQ